MKKFKNLIIFYPICILYVYYTYSLPTLVELKRNYFAGCDSWFVQDIELNWLQKHHKTSRLEESGWFTYFTGFFASILMFIWKFYECRIQFCKICTLYYSHQLNIFISKSSDIIIKEIMIIYLLYSSLEMNSHDDNKGVQMFANFLHPVSRCLVLPLSLSVRQGMMVSQGRWNWLVVVTKLAKNLNVNFTKKLREWLYCINFII